MTKKAIFILGGSIVSAYILMVMGTFVTSTGSGLACPDWPLCYGTVSPPLELSIWFEWGHRLLGALTGIFIIAATIMVFKKYRGAPRYLTGGVLALLFAGVLMGGVIVVTEAPLLNSIIRVAIVSSHLVISTIVLTFLVFTLRYILSASNKEQSEGFDYALLFALVYVQVLIGIIVRYGGATLACPDFPLCNGQLVPSLEHTTVALHFLHRLMALVVFIATAVFFYKSWQSKKNIGGLGLTLALVVAQAVFGVSIVLSGMFLPFIILHGATGFLLMGYLAYQAAPYLFKRGIKEGAEMI